MHNVLCLQSEKVIKKNYLERKSLKEQNWSLQLTESNLFIYISEKMDAKHDRITNYKIPYNTDIHTVQLYFTRNQTFMQTMKTLAYIETFKATKRCSILLIRFQ